MLQITTNLYSFWRKTVVFVVQLWFQITFHHFIDRKVWQKAVKLEQVQKITFSLNCFIFTDKIRMKIKFFYDIIKKDNGDIYFDLHKDDLIGNFEIGNLKMTAKKMFLGKQDISKYWIFFLFSTVFIKSKTL